ncbi:MAG: hypothetical protein AAF921_21040 [Cyanobacteria bacterium P01_D01_bin.44]
MTHDPFQKLQPANWFDRRQPDRVAYSDVLIMTSFGKYTTLLMKYIDILRKFLPE